MLFKIIEGFNKLQYDLIAFLNALRKFCTNSFANTHHFIIENITQQIIENLKMGMALKIMTVLIVF